MIDEEQEQELTEILDDLSNSSTLTDWEKQFLGDMNLRFEKFGEQIRLSTKQWDILHRIHREKGGG